MGQLYLCFYIFMIFGHTICITEAGLLDPIRNIFDGTHERPYLMQFNRLPPFIDNNQALDNTDFDLNKPGQPLDLEDNSKMSTTDPNDLGGPFYQPINPKFPLGDPDPDNSGQPVNNQNDPSDELDPNESWPDEAAFHQSPHIQNILQTKPTTDFDQIIVHKFPDAMKLLGELKKMNQMKEQLKQKSKIGGGHRISSGDHVVAGAGHAAPGNSHAVAGSSHGLAGLGHAVAGGSHGANPGGHGAPSSGQSVPGKNKNKGTKTSTLKHDFNDIWKLNYGGGIPATAPNADGKVFMEKLTERKFYYQVQPVRPEIETYEKK